MREKSGMQSCIIADLLVVDPGGSQCLLKLGEAHDVYVDELNYLVPLGGATGLVPHDPAHDPEN